MIGAKTMTDYEAVLTAARLKLCQIRDRRKIERDLSYEDFYFRTAQDIREQSGVRVSSGWVREQCMRETDPSYLRFGALLNFLEGYDADGLRLGSSTNGTDVASAGLDTPVADDPLSGPNEASVHWERLKEEAKGPRYKLDMSKPNPLMLERAAMGRRKG
jgi:hypothetical protein